MFARLRWLYLTGLAFNRLIKKNVLNLDPTGSGTYVLNMKWIAPDPTERINNRYNFFSLIDLVENKSSMNCFLKGASGRLILLLDRLYFFQLPNMPQQLGSDPELFQVKAGSGSGIKSFRIPKTEGQNRNEMAAGRRMQRCGGALTWGFALWPGRRPLAATLGPAAGFVPLPLPVVRGQRVLILNLGRNKTIQFKNNRQHRNNVKNSWMKGGWDKSCKKTQKKC